MKDWERFFQRAVVDLEGYQISLKGGGDLLKLALHRGRSVEAMEQMKGCPSDYRSHEDEYRSILHTLEEQLAAKTLSLEPALGKLAAVDVMLEDLRDAYENHILSGEGAHEVNIRASEFLEVFSRLCYVPDIAPAFGGDLLALDNKFRRLFYLFRDLTDILDAFREAAVAPQKYWWLTEAPPSESAGNAVLLDITKKIFNSITADTPCPDEQDLAAYAFGEHSPSVESHLLTCRACLEEVIVLRQVRASVPEKPMPGHLIDKVLELTRPKRSKIEQFLDWASRTQERLTDSAFETLNSLFPGPVERSYTLATARESRGMRGGPPAINISLSKWVWYIKRPLGSSIRLIDMTQKEVAELADVLKTVRTFYYILFGAPRGKSGFVEIVKAPKPVSGIPFILETSDLKDCVVLYMFIDIKKSILAELAGSIAASSDPNKIAFTPKDPLLAVIVALV